MPADLTQERMSPWTLLWICVPVLIRDSVGEMQSQRDLIRVPHGSVAWDVLHDLDEELFRHTRDVCSVHLAIH